MRLKAALYLACFLLLLCCGCNPSQLRLHKSYLNSRFAPAASFDQYIKDTQDMIRKARPDCQGPGGEQILAANSPFKLYPEQQSMAAGKLRRGILLIHGLTDSPYQTRALGKFFQNQGFLVYSILLPGHGTVPGDLLDIDHQEWLLAARFGLAELKKEAKELYLGGFSTGGLLAAFLATTRDDIAATFLFAPVFKIKTRAAPLAGSAASIMDWVVVNDDSDYTKYQSMPFAAAAAAYQLGQLMEEQWAAGKSLQVPTFIALSADDKTVSSATTLQVFEQQIKSPHSRLLYYHTPSHKLPANYDQRIRPQQVVDIPKGVLSYSHLSLIVAPSDEHYGQNGDYRNCLHYRSDPDKYRRCSTDSTVLWGEDSSANQEQGIMARLTWNPDFAGLTAMMARFLEQLPSLKAPPK